MYFERASVFQIRSNRGAEYEGSDHWQAINMKLMHEKTGRVIKLIFSPFIQHECFC